MQTIYIKFLDEESRARGFLELAKHVGISSFPIRSTRCRVMLCPSWKTITSIIAAPQMLK